MKNSHHNFQEQNISPSTNANMQIQALIDYLDIDAVHITINRNGELGLIQESGHCAPKGRYCYLLAELEREIISWLVDKALHREPAKNEPRNDDGQPAENDVFESW